MTMQSIWSRVFRSGQGCSSVHFQRGVMPMRLRFFSSEGDWSNHQTFLTTWQKCNHGGRQTPNLSHTDMVPGGMSTWLTQCDMSRYWQCIQRYCFCCDCVNILSSLLWFLKWYEDPNRLKPSETRVKHSQQLSTRPHPKCYGLCNGEYASVPIEITSRHTHTHTM